MSMAEFYIENLGQNLFRNLNMPWPLTVNKADSATMEIRRNYSDEVKFWDELWQQSLEGDPVCDVGLILDDGTEMTVHWCILMLCPYFKALRNSGMYQKNDGKLDMKVCPAYIVRVAIEFLYRGKATVSKDKLKDVIHCADYLQLDHLKFRCADYLRDYRLDLNNCVSMCTLASTYNLESLYDESNRVLRRRFKEVMSKDDILQLVTDSLKYLIGDQNLRYVGQLEWFNLLVRWAEHSDDRKPAFEELFELIDLNDLTSANLEVVVKPSRLVTENENCSARVQKHLDGLKDQTNEDVKDVLVFAGGKKVTSGKISEVLSTLRSTMCYGYVIKENRWIRLCNLPRRMVGRVAVKDGSEMYFLGQEDSSILTRLYKLPNKDAKDGHWTSCPLEQPRTPTDHIFASLFCKDKLVTVRRDSARLFLCMHNPSSPTESAVKPVTSIKSPSDVIAVRMACFKNRHVFVLIVTTRGGSSNKSVIFDTELKHLDVLETKTMCNGDVFYQDGDKAYLETPGKRFSNVFNFNTRRWMSVRRGLPALPNNETLKTSECVKFRNELYVYGVNAAGDANSAPLFYRLSHKRQSWERLEQTTESGLPLLGASMTVLAIPRELLRCPVECTHCAPKYLSEYTVDRWGYDDEDEDEDDMVADDDSIYGPGYYSDSEDEDDFGYVGPYLFW